MSDAAGEAATLLFYVLTGMKFHPSDSNPYFTREEDEESAPLKGGAK